MEATVYRFAYCLPRDGKVLSENAFLCKILRGERRVALIKPLSDMLFSKRSLPFFWVAKSYFYYFFACNQFHHNPTGQRSRFGDSLYRLNEFLV